MTKNTTSYFGWVHILGRHPIDLKWICSMMFPSWQDFLAKLLITLHWHGDSGTVEGQNRPTQNGMEIVDMIWHNHWIWDVFSLKQDHFTSFYHMCIIWDVFVHIGFIVLLFETDPNFHASWWCRWGDVEISSPLALLPEDGYRAPRLKVSCFVLFHCS